MNRLSIVYIGDKPGVEIPFARKYYVFNNRVPRSVPDELAERLLRQDDFLLAEDVGRCVADRLPSGGTVLCRRWGAIGDLLMLRATASAFVREHPSYTLQLRTEDRFEYLFAGDPVWEVRHRGRRRTGADDKLWGPGVEPPKHPDPDLNFSFDQVAEQDHRGVQKHRVDLFAEAMVNRTLKIRPEDWQIPVSALAADYVAAWLGKRALNRDARTRPLVGLQVRGSGKMKSIPEGQVKKLAAELAAEADVVLIEHDPRQVWEAAGSPTSGRVFAMPGRDALHAIELLRAVDLCVCFDSGVLWMAHCAAAPVLCIMGPTRPEQRLSYHPGYPEKAQAFLMNEIVELKKGEKGCPACFEAAERCRQKFSCMQEQPAAVTRLIADRALEMLGLRTRLPVLAEAPAAAPAS